MPGIEDNRRFWTEGWDWSRQGEEWSEWWGGTDAMWFGALRPRLHSFVPTNTVLEIAPGYGRWTQYLKDLCDRLIVVDLAQNCIDHCRRRFADATNIEYHVNDGRSLRMVEDHSVDLVFSFDSLVHAEVDVVQTYLDQLARKLTPDGVGFFHHSNLGSHRFIRALSSRANLRMLRPIVQRGLLLDLRVWRDAEMSADSFSSQCERAGLVCVSQESISWHSSYYMVDTLSVFTPRGSMWERRCATARNPLFRAEAKRMSRLYARTSFRGSPDSPLRDGGYQKD